MTTATTTPETVLEVSGLGVDFWVDGVFYPAAIDLNYAVRRGEVLAIVGESGSGKSSSSMALLGLLPANAKVSGSVKLLGRELHGIPERELRAVRGNQIAVIFQEPMTSLNPLHTIEKQLAESLALHQALTGAAARTRMVELLQKVGIREAKSRLGAYPHQLSGGQRQVVAISRAIYFNARILIMDEPTAALGPEETAMVGNLIQQLKDEGVGIFLISHDMHDVFALSDRLAVMKNGKLVGTYRTQDVTEDEVLGMIILGKQPTGKTQTERLVR